MHAGHHFNDHFPGKPRQMNPKLASLIFLLHLQAHENIWKEVVDKEMNDLIGATEAATVIQRVEYDYVSVDLDLRAIKHK